TRGRASLFEIEKLADLRLKLAEPLTVARDEVALGFGRVSILALGGFEDRINRLVDALALVAETLQDGVTHWEPTSRLRRIRRGAASARCRLMAGVARLRGGVLAERLDADADVSQPLPLLVGNDRDLESGRHFRF